MSSELVLPHDIEVEQAVLGSLLIDETFGELAVGGLESISWLRAEDFYRESHRLIFQAIEECRRDGSAIDIVTVGNRLERADMLDLAGGLPYIHSLATVVPTPIHIQHYAKIVLDNAVRRGLIRMGSTIIQMAYRDKDDARSLLERAGILVNLLEDRYDRGFVARTEATARGIQIPT